MYQRQQLELEKTQSRSTGVHDQNARALQKLNQQLEQEIGKLVRSPEICDCLIVDEFMVDTAERLDRSVYQGDYARRSRAEGRSSHSAQDSRNTGICSPRIKLLA